LDWELLSWGFNFWRASNPEHVRHAAPLLRDLNFASRACFEELSELPDNDFGPGKARAVDALQDRAGTR